MSITTRDDNGDTEYRINGETVARMRRSARGYVASVKPGGYRAREFCGGWEDGQCGTVQHAGRCADKWIRAELGA